MRGVDGGRARAKSAPPSQRPEADVTVVVCCADGAHSFPATVSSLLNQTMRPSAIVVLDCGTNEKYAALIKATAQEQVFRAIPSRSDHYGLTLRLRVLPEITTKYVAVITDEDEFLPSKIEESYNALERTGNDYVVTNAIYTDEHGNLLAGGEHPRNRLTGTESRGHLLADIVQSPIAAMQLSTLVIRTTLARKTTLGDPFWPLMADRIFFVDLLLDDGLRCTVIAAALSRVRLREGADRLNRMFEQKLPKDQGRMLDAGRMEIFDKVLNTASNDILVEFIEKTANIPSGLSVVHALVEASVQLKSRATQHSSTEQMMVPLLFHAAFSRDAIRAIALLRSLSGKDPNSFMVDAYQGIVDTYLNGDARKAENYAGDEAPNYRSKARHLLRHPRKSVVSLYHAWRQLWRHPRKSVVKLYHPWRRFWRHPRKSVVKFYRYLRTGT